MVQELSDSEYKGVQERFISLLYIFHLFLSMQGEEMACCGTYSKGFFN